MNNSYCAKYGTTNAPGADIDSAGYHICPKCGCGTYNLGSDEGSAQPAYRVLETVGPHTLEATKYVIGRTADPGSLPHNDDCRFDAEWITKRVHAATRKDAATKGRRKRFSEQWVDRTSNC